MKDNWPKITRGYKNHGRKVILVDARYEEDGERKGERKVFSSTPDGEAEARGWARQQEIQRRNQSPRGDYALIASEGKSLEDAQRFYAQYLRRLATSKSLSEAVEDLLESKRLDEGIDETRLYDIKLHLANKFASFCGGEKKMAEISLDEVTAFLRTFPHPVTRNKYHKDVGMLWRHCLVRKWVSEDFTVPLATEPEKERKILSVEQAAALMAASGDPEMRALNALVLFGGLRVEEIYQRERSLGKRQLEWSDIYLGAINDYTHGFVNIPSEVAKVGEHRIVALQPNLAAWLLSLPKKRGPIVSRTLMHVQRKTWKCAGLYPWIQDVHRHSFISYYRQIHGDAQTARDAGTSERIIKKHYKRPVHQHDAERYFQIYPPSLPESGKIVPMPTLAPVEFPRKSEAI